MCLRYGVQRSSFGLRTSDFGPRASGLGVDRTRQRTRTTVSVEEYLPAWPWIKKYTSLWVAIVGYLRDQDLCLMSDHRRLHGRSTASSNRPRSWRDDARLYYPVVEDQENSFVEGLLRYLNHFATRQQRPKNTDLCRRVSLGFPVTG